MKIFLLVFMMISSSAMATNFVVLGDAGIGGEMQKGVGDAMYQVCKTAGCEFALYAGDNFYLTGVSSIVDEQFETKFNYPYQSFDDSFKFYVAIGNHDYGGARGRDKSKMQYQLDYSDAHPESKFRIEDRFYQKSLGDVDLFVVDTTRIYVDAGDVVVQGTWLAGALLKSTARWKVVMGHHPYISNGEHGNAGDYDAGGVAGPDNVAAGGNIKAFIETYVCGAADIYISGHDHSLQWPKNKCGTEFIVSGAGAKTDTKVGRNLNAMNFEYYDSPGFVHISTSGTDLYSKFTASFYSVANVGPGQYLPVYLRDKDGNHKLTYDGRSWWGVRVPAITRRYTKTVGKLWKPPCIGSSCQYLEPGYWKPCWKSYYWGLCWVAISVEDLIGSTPTPACPDLVNCGPGYELPAAECPPTGLHFCTPQPPPPPPPKGIYLP